MKVLTVCSYNSGSVSPFIKEQVDSLKEIGVESDYFKVRGKGLKGYLENLKPLKNTVKNSYDLIHAHYGLCGMLANLQSKLPVITTYHGSDIHFFRNRMISFTCSRLSKFNILTNIKQIDQIRLKDNYKIQPCGIDTALFQPMKKSKCRKKLGLPHGEKIILFSSSFDKKVKNASLAHEAVNKLKNVSLLELKGYSRKEVSILINACDAILVTSFYETGPLIVKEALACNTPVVSTDVGDVKDLVVDLNDCHISSFNAGDIARDLSKVLNKDSTCNSRTVIQDYSLQNVAKSIDEIYQMVGNKNSE